MLLVIFNILVPSKVSSDIEEIFEVAVDFKCYMSSHESFKCYQFKPVKGSPTLSNKIIKNQIIFCLELPTMLSYS